MNEITEPEWGSVVLARLNDAEFTTRVRWVHLPAGWQSEDGDYECPYRWLRDVEVLRVGVGDTADEPGIPADEVREVVAYLRAFADRPYLGTRAYAYKRAADHMESQLLPKGES